MTPRKPSFPSLKLGTRDDMVRRLRERALFGAVLRIRGADAAKATGDLRSGMFIQDDGLGEFFIVGWDESGLIALGFDPDCNRSEASLEPPARDPAKHLAFLPPALEPLAARVIDAAKRLATEGFWVTADAEAANRATSLHVIERLLPEPPYGKPSPLVLFLRKVASEDAHVVTSEEAALMLALPGPRRAALKPERAAAVAEEFAALGVVWSSAREDAIAFLSGQQLARKEAESPVNHALLVAAHAGDLEGVKKALAGGAKINFPMPAELLPAMPAGCTALIVALRHDHQAIVEFLLEAGADVNRASGIGGRRPDIALGFAASQGNVELTRELLGRGANVFLDESAWGLLQQVTDPREYLRRGPPAAYAEVIRRLLDAGAPLPKDADCNRLVELAIAGGAPELESRLRRVYAEVVLPEEPTPIDTSASGARVSELLAQAVGSFTSDTFETLRLLVEAWRLSLNPCIGDAAEGLARMTRGTRPALATGDRPTHGEALFAEVKAMREGPVDPRAARALLSWLWTHDMYANKTWVAKTEDEAAAVLVMLRDVRFIESLELHCELGRPSSSLPVRASLEMALRVMKEVVPGALSDADVDHLGALEDHLANRKLSGRRPPIRDLFAAVYDAPEEDEPRRVLAARLTEAGDPRGEFIQLQMKRRAGKVTKRENELLREHGRAWLGEIESLLEEDVVYERGFLTQARLKSNSVFYRVLATGAGTQLEWSTVRRLTLAGSESPGLLRGARTQRIVELIDVGVGHLQELLRSPARPHLERLDLADARGDRWAKIKEELWSTLPDKVPSLTSLQLGARPAGIEDAARIAARLPNLRELSVGTKEPGLAELIALARQRGLTKVRALGLAEFAVTLASGLLEISFDGPTHSKRAAFITDTLASARDLGIRRVIVRTPRDADSTELAAILAAVESLGLPFEVTP